MYRDRQEWRWAHNNAEWVLDDNIKGAMERDNAAMYIFYEAGFSVFNQAGNNPSTEIIVRHSNGGVSELNSPRASCLDGEGFGMTFTTGIDGSIACACRQIVSNGVARINCDDSIDTTPAPPMPPPPHPDPPNTPPPSPTPPSSPPPPPIPSSPPPPPSSPPPPASPAIYWELHAHLNCWWGGHGSEEVDSPLGAFVNGIDSLDGCKDACLAVSGCEGILWHLSDAKCYRKRSITPSRCASDEGFDLYIITIPSPPPPPYLPGQRRIITASELNQRFQDGSNRGSGSTPPSLSSHGLILHQFDFMDAEDPTGTPWIPGSGRLYRGTRWQSAWDWGDRISGTIVNAEMTPEFSQNIPIYSFSLAGIILSPEHNRLLCSYAYDTDTLESVCRPRGGSETCIPGCTRPWHATEWCTDVNRDQWPCAWRPTETASMLQRRENLRASGQQPEHKRFNDGKFYVEAIFDAQTFVDNLPHSIEAVFYLDQDCTDAISGQKCENYARRAHQNMLSHFGLTSEQLPLLQFDPWNWNVPFRPDPSG